MGSHRVGHDWGDLAAAAAADKDSYREKCADYLHHLHCKLFWLQSLFLQNGDNTAPLAGFL